MTFSEAIVLAIIEGITEFLPVSSTAHMIFASSIFGIESDEFVKMFQVSIQFGAILAVVSLYWRRFFNFSSPQIYIKLIIGVIPALVLGKLFDDKIEAVLEKPIPIALMLILGGVVLLFIDRLFNQPRLDSVDSISKLSAVKIGFWQCLAMMPGTSRSAASIIGGMQQGLSRKAAAEFSFFLAVPTMFAVTCYSLFLKDWTYKGTHQTGIDMILSSQQNTVFFIVGNSIAFLIAAIAIKFFIEFLQKYGFKVWGWYRVLMGCSLLIYFLR